MAQPSSRLVTSRRRKQAPRKRPQCHCGICLHYHVRLACAACMADPYSDRLSAAYASRLTACGAGLLYYIGSSVRLVGLGQAQQGSKLVWFILGAQTNSLTVYAEKRGARVMAG
jgi:hypothetical protein